MINANRGIGLGSNIGGSGTINVPTGGTTLYQGSIANAGSGAASLVVNGGASSPSPAAAATVAARPSAMARLSWLSRATRWVRAGHSQRRHVVACGNRHFRLGRHLFSESRGAGTWFTTSGASDTNLGDNAGDVPTALSGVISYFNLVSPVVKAPTTTGGLTSLTFPAATGGNAFASQGFSGTADYEAVFWPANSYHPSRHLHVRHRQRRWQHAVHRRHSRW